MAARKPLNFKLDEQPEPGSPTPAANANRTARTKPETAEQRQQVGARIRAATYRQLKARAALEGRKVQDLVELAVERYLATPDV
jgi:hypothetical protein